MHNLTFSSKQTGHDTHTQHLLGKSTFWSEYSRRKPEEITAYLLVFVFRFPVATGPRGRDVTGDDGDLVQWHVHPSRADQGTVTHTLPVREPEQRA